MRDRTSDPFRDRLQASLGPALQLQRELEGGSARVFVALDRALGREVVVKALMTERVAEAGARRFAREMRIAARLQHPHILPVLAAGDANGIAWYSMPYVTGQSLRARLTQRRALPVPEAVRVLRDVARALAFAHRAGIVHRDIKPDNVLLSDDIAVVIDFGIAKAVAAVHGGTPDGDDVERITRQGIAVGTLAYVAPEQAAALPDVDCRADLYAFGCLGYELLAGVPPFHGRSARELPRAHLAEAPAPIATRCPAAPAALARLIDACLAKSPLDRPALADDVVRRLDAILADVVGRGEPLATASPVTASSVAASPASAPAGRGRPPTVLVLPFENRSSEPEGALFADGLTEEVIGTLGRVPALRVLGRASSFALKGQQGDPRAIAERLHATAVVAGSVRMSDRRVRIVVDLTDARDGVQRWAQRYDRDLVDMIAVQDEIAGAIALALVGQLDDGEPEVHGAGRPTVDPEALRAYLRGQHALRQRPADLAGADEYFRRAVAHDPRFWRACAAAAGVIALGALGATDEIPAHALGEAAALATLAVAGDPRLATGHAALGLHALVADWAWGRARSHFARALALDPAHELAATWGALLEAAAGRPAEGEAILNATIEVQPFAPWRRRVRATVRRLAGRDDAYEPLRTPPAAALLAGASGDGDLAESDVDRLHEMALLELRAGRPELAARWAERAVALGGRRPRALATLARCRLADGHRNDASALAAELAAAAAPPVTDAALLLWELGRLDEGDAWLERAAGARDVGVVTLGVDPAADAFRARPQVAAVVRAVWGLGDRPATLPA